MGNIFDAVGDVLEDVRDSVRGVLGDSGLGAILGFALGGPLGAAIGGGLGGAYGGGGLQGAALGALGGYGLGNLATSAGIPSLVSRGATTAAAPMLANPMGSGFTGTGPTVGGTGIAALKPYGMYNSAAKSGAYPGYSSPARPHTGMPSTLPSVTPPMVQEPSGLDWDPYEDTSLAANAKDPDRPFWESPWLKYGLGGAMLLGIGEKPEYDEISIESKPSIVDRYYDDVAKYGIENVPIPAELQPTPIARQHDFGSRRQRARMR